MSETGKKSTGGIKSMKNNGQILTDKHQLILDKLSSKYEIRTTEIGPEVLEYINFIRYMRPFDKSISFIDEISK